MASLEFASVADCFASCNGRFQGLDSGQLSTDSDISNLIHDLITCKGMVTKADLFSKNEDLDEYATSSIKYLVLDYYLAKCHSNVTDLYIRKDNLLQAAAYFHSYIELCIRLHLLNEAESHEYENHILRRGEGTSSAPVNATEMRNQKIANFKRDKEAKARMEIIQKLMRAAEDSGEDLDSEYREYLLLRLQMFARDSFKELHSIAQEITLLDHMAELRELDELNQSDCREPQGREGASSSAMSRPGPRGLPRSDAVAPQPGEGPGISITKTAKVGDQIILTRDTVKATVFTPRMSAPTMSLEEFGDRQLQQLREREEASAQRAATAEETAPRRYNQLVIDGDEDNADLVDKATDADREWDAWKESNPKGWGNKMGKRF